MSGVGSTEPPRSEGPGSAGAGAGTGGVGSTEPPRSEGPGSAGAGAGTGGVGSTEPPRSEGTACDFSLRHYRELLQAAQRGGYRFAGFDRAPEPGTIILRHDVDLSLASALAVAEVEAQENVWSTWFLMTRSVFYNLASQEGERTIVRLRELGHRIAHHAVWPDVDLDDRFDPVVAWHNPDPEYMQAEIPGAVNVMGVTFFDPEHYRSDSNQNWRHGCPHDDLEQGSFEWLQLLTHPEIWVFEGATMRASMESMLDADRAARLEQLRHDRIDLS